MPPDENGVSAPVSANGWPLNVKPNCVESPAGTTTLSIVIVPRCVLVNVQLTVSPGATTIAPTGEPLSHVALLRSQPAGMSVSLTAYVPGLISPLSPDWPSVNVRSLPAPFHVPSKVNGCADPSGSVCLLTTILPSCVLLNVHVTV